MSKVTTRLQVLLVEDEPEDLTQYERDFPSVFSSCQVEADIHPCVSFEDAFERTSNPLYRYDLIISDTYKGEIQNRDAQVMQMVNDYRGTRFCPMVVYSSGVQPPELEETAFVIWADKGKPRDIERAIKQLIETNIPQLARKLHDELERSAGSYLWEFLEKKWDYLTSTEKVDAIVLERLIRRRAALQIGRLNPDAEMPVELDFIEGMEFYLYPPTSKDKRLGSIIKNKSDESFRVILTPHCHLTVQQNETYPRADYVLTIKAFSAIDIIDKAHTNHDGTKRNPWSGKKNDKLRRRIQSPADAMGKPSGRYWFMPSFLDIIPDMYCDYLQLDSILYTDLDQEFDHIATIDTPFAEALQSCFTRFYSAVGIPSLEAKKFRHLVREESDS